MSDQRELLAQWSQSQGNLRRFLEDRVMPPLDDDAQRTAGRAAAAAAVEETFGINLDDFTLGVDSVGGAFATAGRGKITLPDPEIPQDAEAAAFFDVDNTLIQGSSLILLAQGLFKKRFITLSELAPALRKQIRYRVSGSENADDIAEGREQALAVVKGKSVAELKAACREIVDNRMLEKSYADTIELASMHLAAGQQVWLVSATPVQIGQALAETLGFTGALGTGGLGRDLRAHRAPPRKSCSRVRPSRRSSSPRAVAAGSATPPWPAANARPPGSRSSASRVTSRFCPSYSRCTLPSSPTPTSVPPTV